MEKVAQNGLGGACRQREASQPAEQCENPQDIRKPGHERHWAVLLGLCVDFKRNRAEKIVLPHSVAQGWGTLALPSGDETTSPGAEETMEKLYVSQHNFFICISVMPDEYLSLEKEKSPASYPDWLRTRKTEKAIVRSVFFFMRNTY